MAPLSARRRKNGDDAASIANALRLRTGEFPAFTDVQQVAMTPRTGNEQKGMTPRPVVRGPQGSGGKAADRELGPDEEARVEKIFFRYDRHNAGEVDMAEFYGMCASLDLPLDQAVARDWLAGRCQGTGLTVMDVKALYAKILAAQSPAVRTVACRKAVRLRDILGAESGMRAAFQKYAKEGLISVDSVSEVLVSLGFPDVYGDTFDRFVSEWAEMRTNNGPVNFHDFVNCVNLLVEFSERQQEQQ